MKVGLRELHAFLTKTLPPRVLRHYKKFEILNETDLQFYVTRHLRNFLRHDDEKGRLEIHGCLSCRDSKSSTKTFPDVIVMHRGRPWVVIELKESSRVRTLTAAEEREKIHRQRHTLKAKHGYLMYIGRWGRHRVLRGRKGPYGFWFFEVPIVLERSGMSKEAIRQFQATFR